MPELTTILAREARTVDLEPGHYERLLRRHDRRRRNRRIGSALLAIAIAAATIGYAIDVLHRETERIPMDRITSRNVARLGLVWTASAEASSGAPGSPTLRNGIVYVDVGAGEGSGGIMGFPLSCAATNGSCLPAWSADVPHELTGIAVDEQNLYVGEGLTVSTTPSPTSDHYRLEVFRRSCGSNPCRPIWTTKTVRAEVEPIEFVGGRLYVRLGRWLQAYRSSCGHATCEPVWTARGVGPPTLVDGRAIVSTRSGLAMFSSACWMAHGPACPQIGKADTDVSGDATMLRPPLVVDGRVFLGAAGGIQAFPQSCRGSCRPLWHATVPRGSGFEPVVADGMLLAAAEGGSELFAFHVDCPDAQADRTCAPAWIGHVEEGVGFPPVVTGDRVIVGAAFGSSLNAFPLTCVGDCLPAWTARLDDSITFPPVVSDDVVVVSGVRGLTAFPAGCADPCQPLFHWDLPTGSPQMSPLVENDALVLIGGNTLNALRLGGGGEPMQTPTDRDRAAPLGLVAVGLAALILVAALRRKRSAFT
jgi:hypothetical protein